jgi:hypothetical protein
MVRDCLAFPRVLLHKAYVLLYLQFPKGKGDTISQSSVIKNSACATDKRALDLALRSGGGINFSQRAECVLRSAQNNLFSRLKPGNLNFSSVERKKEEETPLVPV